MNDPLMKPFTQHWWNFIANKALRQSYYNIKYIEIVKFCWHRAEIKQLPK